MSGGDSSTWGGTEEEDCRQSTCCSWSIFSAPRPRRLGEDSSDSSLPQRPGRRCVSSVIPLDAGYHDRGHSGPSLHVCFQEQHGSQRPRFPVRRHQPCRELAHQSICEGPGPPAGPTQDDT